MLENLKDKWHDFKIWFCKEEVDFFQKEIERWRLIVEVKKCDFEALNKADTDSFNYLQKQIDELKKERQDLLFLDPSKIITTEKVVIDELGRPVQKKVILLNGEPLTPEQTKILQSECAYVKRTLWWDIVQNTVVNTAKLKMFEGSKDYSDMVGGKGILYAADIYRKILDRILE